MLLCRNGAAAPGVCGGDTHIPATHGRRHRGHEGRMPNLFAYAMLFAWPLVVFAMFRRMRVERALVWAILGGYLILPPVVAIDLPLIPGLDKHAIPALSAFICILAMRGRGDFLPKSRAVRLLLVVAILSPFATVLTNREPIAFANGALPGLRLYDAFSAIAYQFIGFLPMLLARRVLATREGIREILVALVITGLFYSVPMVFEARMSPQLNIMIYGFFQHEFLQMMRFGGFRPIVFLQHGLWVALFTLTALAAAVACARMAPPKNRLRYIVAAGYLAVILVICRSVGPLVYAMALLPMVLLLAPALQIRIAAILAVVVVAYPILRGADLVPVATMLNYAERVDADRALSLKFRFDQEAALLAHAERKPLFGWGAWQRNQILDQWSGRSISVSDGRWIIVLGIGGWIAFLAEFGLLALPLVLLATRKVGLPEAGALALKSIWQRFPQVASDGR